MKVIDLTHEITSGMMVYPGDPQVEISEALKHESDYCHVDSLRMGSHTGTHIDAPYHFLPRGKRITDYPLSKFTGEGIALDLSDKKDNEAIEADDLEKIRPLINKGDILVLCTGWYRHFGSDRYLNHPFLSRGAAVLIVEMGISIVAVDFLNVDPTLYESWEAHPVLLSNDVLIVENVNDSMELEGGRRYRFAFAPLKLNGSDGSPIRAFAMEIPDHSDHK